MAELGNKLSSGSWSSPEHRAAWERAEARGVHVLPAGSTHGHRDPPSCAGGAGAAATGAAAVPELGTDPRLPTAHTGQGLPLLSEGLQNFTHFAFQKTLFRSKGNQVLLAEGKHQEAKGL